MTLPKAKMTATEYLLWEVDQKERHSFIAGQVFEREVSTLRHNLATGGTGATLWKHLKGTRCKVFMVDMRLSVLAADAYFYPDVIVTCDEIDTQDPKVSTMSAPKLLVEVLSPSTASFDRGQKFTFYRTLPSLEEYVLIDPDLRTVEVFRKNANGFWALHFSDAEQPAVSLLSVGWSGVMGDLLE
jgi:Uma2 family endonuclease